MCDLWAIFNTHLTFNSVIVLSVEKFYPRDMFHALHSWGWDKVWKFWGKLHCGLQFNKGVVHDCIPSWLILMWLIRIWKTSNFKHFNAFHLCSLQQLAGNLIKVPLWIWLQFWGTEINLRILVYIFSKVYQWSVKCYFVLHHTIDMCEGANTSVRKVCKEEKLFSFFHQLLMSFFSSSFNWLQHFKFRLQLSRDCKLWV